MTEQSEERLLVVWRGAEVGTLSNPRPDMWLMDGTFEGNGSDAANAFLELAESFDAQVTMRDPETGTRIELRSPESIQPTHALVLSLDDGLLSIRRVIDAHAVRWLKDHVR